MKGISDVLKLHYRDKWSWLCIPLIVLFFSFSVNLIISFLVPSQDAFYTGGISSIFIYIFVAGISVVAQTFPFAIGMSIRRIDYFVGSVLVGTISCLFYAGLVFLFVLLEKQTNGWGNRLHFFHFPFVNDGTFLEQLALYMILFSNLFFLGFIISCFAHRFGGKGMFWISMACLLIGSIATLLLRHFDAWVGIFSWFTRHTAIEIAYWLIPFILIYLLGSYRLLRRSVI